MNARTILSVVLAVFCILLVAGLSISRDERGEASVKLPSAWRYSGPLISPEKRDELPSRAQKDPTVVFFKGKWHVFMTVKLKGLSAIEYCSFEKWDKAHNSKRTILKLTDSKYYCAPQVFYFTPHKKWYLIYQLGRRGKRRMQIAFSTTTDIADPQSWTKAGSVFRNDAEDPRTEGGLDYWMICDSKRAYLFITSLNGKMWRMSAKLKDFPHGFGDLVLALRADIFEASHTYKLSGTDKYLTVVEANPGGRRYYKAYLADRLDGKWTPVSGGERKPFAGAANVSPADGVTAWTDNISHGELIRKGYDQTLLVDPKNLRFIFQGALQKEKAGRNYGAIPWRIGMLTPAAELAKAPVKAAAAAAKKYKPTWESIDSRPLPGWFNEAKFGIFVVWGPYSVPAWVDRGYAEWYWNRSRRKGSATSKFHEKMYGKDFPYEKFAEQLTAKLYNPDYWCEIFVRSGAKYVVTTANYHDGFCLWDSPYSKTKNTDKWNAAVVGPKRNVLRELFDAGAKRGLKMGIYYSLYEWYHPLYLTDRKRYVTEHLHPQFKDVVTKFKPWFIFLDGEWEADYKLWRSFEMATWLYNESPCRDYVVTNDRWGKTRRKHGDVYSSEYGGGKFSPKHPWQEDRGIGHSYGYNRNEGIDAYDSEYTLIKMLSRVCGNGGNLLLDVGPTADGRIPVIMQDRLVRIGKWLKVNGQAIYGTRHSPFWPRKFPWGTCTAKGSKIFLHVWGRQSGEISLPGLKNKTTAAYALADADKKPLRRRVDKKTHKIELPTGLRAEHVVVLVVEVEGKPSVDASANKVAKPAK